MKALFLVGKFIAETSEGIAWEFQGVFSSREKAIAACRTPMYCIMPIELDADIPDAPHEFPICEYPLAEMRI